MIEMPSVWWEAHITSPTVNVAGVAIPGIPFVIIGHNERIGWGLTNVGADVQDFFLEQLDPSRQKYLEGGTWVPLDTTHYTIRVSGRDRPIEFDVRSTRHGPVLNAADWYDPLPGVTPDLQPVEKLDQTVLALKWPVVEGVSAAAFNALARAEFRVCGRRRQHRLCDVRHAAGAFGRGRLNAGARVDIQRRLDRHDRRRPAADRAESADGPDRDSEQ
jgi:hypothetical protein